MCLILGSYVTEDDQQESRTIIINRISNVNIYFLTFLFIDLSPLSLRSRRCFGREGWWYRLRCNRLEFDIVVEKVNVRIFLICKK